MTSEGYIPIGNTKLYYRETGNGQPLLLLHGGPDFDHTYLRPEMDQLSDRFRLIYYDQRGRGKSAENVLPEGVTIRSEVEDIEAVREHFGLENVSILGHSWGAVLALEYALQQPDRVSHLILMNAAPVSRADYLLLRRDRRARSPGDIEQLKVLFAEAKYQEGDPDTVAAYYRIHFRAALRRPEHLEKIIRRLRASFSKGGILKARTAERQLMHETWLSDEFNLLPQLRQLQIPTLVIHGDHDFIPVECAAHIARAIPGARFVLLKECGHFSYLECREEVYRTIEVFLDNA